MKYRRRSRLSSEVNASSLNDIMFFLLLFFLIVSTLVNPSVIKLLLPKANRHTVVPPKQTVTVTVTKDLQYYIDNTPVPFDNLETQLAQRISTIPDATIILRADRELQLQDVVNVLEVGSRLKVKMILATTNK